uniref:Pre-mRNA-splicing factor 38 n=2 Tax=Caenorhabditis japonica TaxID=281687 RepID=A0A8R1HQS8_CAEJA
MDTVQAIIQQQIEAGTFLQSVQQGQQAQEQDYQDEEYEDEDGTYKGKRSNTLPIWGNQVTMNLNTLVLENIRESYYYKNNLIEIDSFQALVEQIFYQVKHLEPWEKGTRRLQGMTGMCGGVRGVGAGGVVSSAFCILYRLFNLRMTRKQLISMLNSRQSVYIRGIGFMYIRYTQPPSDLWYWLEPYLDDESEIDPRSGGGDCMTFGMMVRTMINKLDWYGTLFPRIPVPIQKEIDEKFAERKKQQLLEDEEWQAEELAQQQAPEEKPKESLPKVSRCKHHLRHHHCRKHRKVCPTKAKRLREEKERENKNKNGDVIVGQERCSHIFAKAFDLKNPH